MSAHAYVLTVTKSGSGSGTVTPSAGTLSWSGNTGTASYTSGTSVTLSASPASGSTFTGWSGDCSGTGTCAVSMNANKTVNATFNAVPAKDFTLVNSGNIYATVLKEQAGDSSATAITAIPYNGFSSNISFPVASVTVSPSLPAGSTFSFSPSNLPQSQYSSVSQFLVHIGAGLTASQLYTFTIQGIGGNPSLTRTNTVYLNVQVKNPGWIEI